MLTNEHLPNNALWLKRIEDALIRHINSHSHPAITFPLAVKYAPDLAEFFLNALQERLDDNDNQQLLQNVCFEGQYRSNMYYGLNTSESYDTLQYLTHKRILPEQITRAFSRRFDQIFQENANRPNEHIRFGLENAMKRFSISNFPIEQLSHLNTSNVVPKWILTTLYLTATTNPPKFFDAVGLPKVNQDPFPFLRMLYPEHNVLWKTMLKSILLNEPDALDGYIKQQHQLFNTLSATFLPGKPTLSDILSISETMGMSCIDYIASACEKAHALELSNLDGTMFDLAP